MENLGYYNGKFGPLSEMQVPMLDRVCYFGDGCYDATCAHNHVIHDLDLHIDRFYNSAALLSITIPMEKKELGELLCRMVGLVDSPDQFIYWQVTRGTGIRNHAYPDSSTVKANIWIMLTPCTLKDPYEKVKLITREDTRFYHCNIKTLNLIPSVMAANAAAEAGAYECVFHRGEEVTECAHSNVSILQKGCFVTHPADNLILPGIARRNLIAKCGQLGIPVCERAFSMEELFEADEVIVSASSTFCLAAEEIDGRPVGGKASALLKKLQEGLVSDFIKECGPWERF